MTNEGCSGGLHKLPLTILSLINQMFVYLFLASYGIPVNINNALYLLLCLFWTVRLCRCSIQALCLCCTLHFSA